MLAHILGERGQDEMNFSSERKVKIAETLAPRLLPKPQTVVEYLKMTTEDSTLLENPQVVKNN